MTEVFRKSAGQIAWEQSRLTSGIFSSSVVQAMLEQDRRTTAVFRSSAIQALEERNGRTAELVRGVAFQALLDQQRRAAAIAQSPALKALAQQQMQIVKVAESPALKALAEQQSHVARITQSSVVKAFSQQQNTLARVLEAPSFRRAFLRQSKLVTDAFATMGTSPAWKRVIADIQENPAVTRWARTLADSLAEQVEAGQALSLETATTALLESESLRASLHEVPETETAPLEAIADVTAEAVAAGLAETEADDAGDAESQVNDDQDAANYRALIRIWGSGNVVAVCVLGAIISGQWLVVLGVLAALSQITGVTLKDLLNQLGGEGD